MKKILLIGTGGTIASAKTEGGLSPQLKTDELLKYIPDIVDKAIIDTYELFSIDSTNIQPKHWLSMAETIQSKYNEYEGFVICHGTDTMSYTASALSYLIQNSNKPIVITGSQKPIDMDVTDAKTNLYDSILFAADDRAYNVNIVFDGKVICGTRARKERTKSYNAFASLNFPYIAQIQDGNIIFFIDDKDKNTEKCAFYNKLNAKIGLLKLVPGLDSQILKFMSLNYDAIVIEAFGVGGLPTYEEGDFKSAISDLSKLGKTIVMTTQVPLEGSQMSIYEVGKLYKDNFGIMESHDMSLESCICKLMWILAHTKDADEINKLFYKKINKDILK